MNSEQAAEGAERRKSHGAKNLQTRRGALWSRVEFFGGKFFHWIWSSLVEFSRTEVEFSRIGVAPRAARGARLR